MIVLPILFLSITYFMYSRGTVPQADLLLFEKLNKLKEEKVLLEIKKQSLESVLSGISKENENLLSQIALLKSKKQDIKYIDIVKYETKEIIVEKESLPLSFLFKTEEGMPICSFEYKENYFFKVIPIE